MTSPFENTFQSFVYFILKHYTYTITFISTLPRVQQRNSWSLLNSYTIWITVERKMYRFLRVSLSLYMYKHMMKMAGLGGSSNTAVYFDDYRGSSSKFEYINHHRQYIYIFICMYVRAWVCVFQITCIECETFWKRKNSFPSHFKISLLLARPLLSPFCRCSTTSSYLSFIDYHS